MLYRRLEFTSIKTTYNAGCTAVWKKETLFSEETPFYMKLRVASSLGVNYVEKSN